MRPLHRSPLQVVLCVLALTLVGLVSGPAPAYAQTSDPVDDLAAPEAEEPSMSPPRDLASAPPGAGKEGRDAPLVSEPLFELSFGTTMVGTTFVPVGIDFRKTRRVELHLATFIGIATGGDHNIFPMLAARIYLLHADDVAIYAGVAFALRVDTLGLIYGLSYRF